MNKGRKRGLGLLGAPAHRWRIGYFRLATLLGLGQLVPDVVLDSSGARRPLLGGGLLAGGSPAAALPSGLGQLVPGVVLDPPRIAASYLVPLDREAQATFGGLLRWAWPWSIGDGGLLGRMPASGEYPISGVFLAGAAALMFILAALAVIGWWVPFGWWRVLATGGAILSFLLMAGFFGATKVLPMALDLVVLWLAITDRIATSATG